MVSSAMSVGYSQTWIIDRDGDTPAFEILESIGNASIENVEGKTAYAQTSWERPGEEIRGTFGRDGTRRGTFRMFRTPPIRPLLSEADGKTPNERMLDEATKTGKLPTLPF